VVVAIPGDEALYALSDVDSRHIPDPVPQGVYVGIGGPHVTLLDRQQSLDRTAPKRVLNCPYEVEQRHRIVIAEVKTRYGALLVDASGSIGMRPANPS
jgi:hypothetical protein